MYGYDDENRNENIPVYTTVHESEQVVPETVDTNTSEAVKKKEKKEKKRHGKFWGKLFATIGFGVLFGLVTGVTLYLMNEATGVTKANKPMPQTADKAVESEKEPVTLPEPESEIQLGKAENEIADSSAGATTVTDVTQVVDAVMPSVVSINGNYVVTSQDFFGQVYSQEATGSGSGIIVAKTDTQLLIATNNHVVEDSESLEVQFIDGKTANAKIKGTDADMDLAVIIVDLEDVEAETRKSIEVAKLGDSQNLKVGEPAIAIGNALGYGQSVTTGVISAVDREIDMQDGAVATGLIQTDAAINPGNSGGALVNIKGEVIGINSSKIGGATVDGVGFAIPISSAQPILSDIVTSKDRVKVSEAEQGYLGISGVTVTEEASQMYGMPVGVQVRNVYDGTGAREGGMLSGDIVTKIGRKSIKSMEELREELTYYESGEEVEVTVARFESGDYVDEVLTIKLSDGDSLPND
ncbi:MAG: trypsin-like peptidase domain-containing protein [Lachnospiraceae bacterium]|nr:trypsin-like peptidase domain-containing protein [Candidatus Colinaster equi]